MSEKSKAAALSAATKGLSRVQAERAAANATRNVNAYGQKEEGPSRWQEKKQAKTQMYLESTEKQATLNQKRCQKCKQTGHWTYECQKQATETPKYDVKALFTQHESDGVDLKKEEKSEKSSKKKKEKSSKRRHKKRNHRSRSSSESSDSESDSEDDEKRRKIKRHSRRSNGGRR